MNLKEIATISAGYPFRGKIPEQAGSPVVAVQMKDVSLSEGIRWSACTRTLLTGKRKPDYLTPSDILLAARGSHNYAVQVGEALLTTGKQAVAAPHFFVVSLTYSGILPEFLVWLLNQAPVQRYFEQNAEGSLTKSIRRRVLEDAPIVVPPLANQQTIAAMAHNLHRERKLVQQLILNSERMMHTIAGDLFNNEEASP